MDETTLTEESAVDTSAAEALLADMQTDTAEVSTDETQTDLTTGADETVDAEAKTKATTDEDATWLKSVGVDPEDPEAVVKLAKIARDNQRAARASGESTKLRDSAKAATETGNELVDEVQQLKINSEIRDFNDSLRDEGMKKADILAINDEMAELLEAKPHLAKDLNDAYAIVKSRRLEAQLSVAKSEGRKQAKTDLAKKSVAAGPTGNASEAVDTKAEEDAFLKGFNSTN